MHPLRYHCVLQFRIVEQNNEQLGIRFFANLLLLVFRAHHPKKLTYALCNNGACCMKEY